MKVVIILIRVLLGLMFVVFGANAFHPFMPMPPLKGAAAAFIGALSDTGYIKAIASFEVAGGALLLLGRFVPLGLTLLGPIFVNILLFHIFIDPSGLPVALVVCAMALFLLWHHRSAFAGLVRP